MKTKTKPRTWIMQPWQVRAALDGRLGQLRVPVKPQPEHWLSKHLDSGFREMRELNGGWWGAGAVVRGESTTAWACRDSEMIRCPFGPPGSVVVGKETYAIESNCGYQDVYEKPDSPLGPVRWVRDEDDDADSEWFECPRYKASEPDTSLVLCEGEDDDDVMRWRSAQTMPAWASRFLFVVTAVRVERLQDSRESDVRKMGLVQRDQPDDFSDKACIGYDGKAYMSPAHVLSAWWNERYGKAGFPWEASPWCWVVGLERVEA